MREAGRIGGLALASAGAAVRPGVTTQELNDIFHSVIVKNHATPNVLGQYGFTRSVCISVNEELIHGTPGKRKLVEGDIVTLDGGARFEGFHSDTAATFAVGKVSETARRLIDVTKRCFYEAAGVVRPGAFLREISRVMQTRAETEGFSVCRMFTGHGIGRELHEDPEIPCFVTKGRGGRITAGMTFCIEPMVCSGHWDVEYAADNFTVVTKDRKMCAHYEHTVLVTETGYELLTKRAGDEPCIV